MKNLIAFICFIGFWFIVSFTSVEQVKFLKAEPIKLNIKEPIIVDVSNEIDYIPIVIIERNTHYDFLEAIGHKESRNRYDIVNKYGYMGKYQFGKSTLRGLGFKVSKNEFLSNPILQEEAMQSLLEHNYSKLKSYIEQYDGQTINGILVTESGLLAAAHLGGPGSVKKWFKKGKVKKDAFGTSITSYMSMFGGYNLNINRGIN